MSTPFSAATAAYANAARLISGAAKPAAEIAPVVGPGPDFGMMLADHMQSVLDSGAVANQKAMEMVDGRGNMVDVATAIAETEMAVESMVAVRDRVISAYEEIMRVPI